MAILKAGTYRFNDVLSAPSADLEQSISFTTTPAFTFDEGTMSMVSLDGVMDWATIVVANNFAGFPVIVNFCDTYDNPSTVYAKDNGDWSFLADFCADVGFSNTEFLNGYGQTITIPNDTEVSAEFAEWFTANAVADGVQISGKWKFKDVLTAPSTSLEQSINFTITVEGASAIGGGVYDGVGQSIKCTNSVMAYYLTSVVPDAPGITPPVNLGIYYFEELQGQYLWNSYFPNDIKTIDFGTELQNVSVEFYEWFMSNAVEDIDYLIKSYTLSAIADSIRTKFGKTNKLTPVGMSETILSIPTYTGESSKNEIIILSGEEAMF